jgi:N-acetylglucosamine-6-phosphate deacetylase
MTNRLVIKNGNVLYDDVITTGKTLVIEAGRIVALEPELASQPAPRPASQPAPQMAPRPSDTVIDARGGYVLPGFVDQHSHGMRDVMVDKDDIHRYAGYQLDNGVTACLPTLANDPASNMARMKSILAETRDFQLAPNLVGFRPEIMYLVDASAGPASSVVRPDPDLTEAVWEASGGRIRIWDISPELEGAIPFIEWCAAHGVVSSLAHSAATIPQVREAVAAGLGLVTHLYDLFVIPKEDDEGVYPAGVTDYINVEDRLSAEIIPDGVHAHPLLVETTIRCKGLDRVAFITDSLMGSGLPPGRYEGLVPNSPVEVTATRGIRRISDGILSGSALTQLQSFRNAINKFGKSIPQASRLCSRTPARIIGLDRKGRIAPDMDADVVVLGEDLSLKTVILAGEVVRQ